MVPVEGFRVQVILFSQVTMLRGTSFVSAYVAELGVYCDNFSMK